MLEFEHVLMIWFSKPESKRRNFILKTLLGYNTFCNEKDQCEEKEDINNNYTNRKRKRRHIPSDLYLQEEEKTMEKQINWNKDIEISIRKRLSENVIKLEPEYIHKQCKETDIKAIEMKKIHLGGPEPDIEAIDNFIYIEISLKILIYIYFFHTCYLIYSDIKSIIYQIGVLA